MSYSQARKAVLGKYKTDNFRDVGPGFWRNVKYSIPHILPKENKVLNLLETCRKHLHEEGANTIFMGKSIKLHKYFHHLNSSQAMCMNFFFPMLQERKLEWITDIIGLPDETINYDACCFEKEGYERESGRAATNFDFYIETKSGKKIFFEIKYTEDGFGKVKMDANYENKLNEVYFKNLEPIAAEYREPSAFLNNYQILRNIWHIRNEETYVVFIYPKDNSKVDYEAKFANKMVAEAFQKNFKTYTWEYMLANVFRKELNLMQKEYYSKFENKYLTP